mgnify:CR=1 FL=1
MLHDIFLVAMRSLGANKMRSFLTMLGMMIGVAAVILMLVGSNRGVSVLPDWVLRDVESNADYITRPLGDGTITKRLYAATREDDVAKPYIAHFLKLGRSEPVKLQRA